MRSSTSRSALLLALIGLPGCGAPSDVDGREGRVVSDGSSTVFPLAEALAEDYHRAHPDARIVVGRSGTGGGLARLCAGEIDIANASREMTEAERERCAEAGIVPVVLTVARDGVSVVTHPDNTFVTCLTVDELARIWHPRSDVSTWREIRAEFPNRPLELFGAGPGSGTFDFFSRALTGRAGASRADYQSSEDDNVLVQGVSGDRAALGYFGYAYVARHRERLRLLAVDGGAGCVLPDPASIRSGRYAPLSRSLYMVVSEAALRRPAVRAYLDWFFARAPELVTAAGSVPLPDSDYAALRARVGA